MLLPRVLRFLVASSSYWMALWNVERAIEVSGIAFPQIEWKICYNLHVNEFALDGKQDKKESQLRPCISGTERDEMLL